MKIFMMLFLLEAEKRALAKNDVIRAAEIRADYNLLCEGFYDKELFEEA